MRPPLHFLSLSRYGFEHYDVNRIEAVTYGRNKNSGRVLQKAKFEHEGTLKKYLLHSKLLCNERIIHIKRVRLFSLLLRKCGACPHYFSLSTTDIILRTTKLKMVKFMLYSDMRNNNSFLKQLHISITGNVLYFSNNKKTNIHLSNIYNNFYCTVTNKKSILKSLSCLLGEVF